MRIVRWVGSSKSDLKGLPKAASTELGHALYSAQEGEMPRNAKPLKGFGGASVLEICENIQTNAYRLVYTVKFEEALYVLHSFQKKSTIGIKTSQNDIEIIKQRLKIAEEKHKEWKRNQK